MAQDNPLSKPVANPLLLPYSGQGQGQNLPAPSLSPDSGLGKLIMEETQRPAQEGMPFHQSHPVLFTLMSLLPGFGQGYSRAQADKARQEALQFSQRHQQAQDLLNYQKLMKGPLQKPVSNWQGPFDPITGQKPSSIEPKKAYKFVDPVTGNIKLQVLDSSTPKNVPIGPDSKKIRDQTLFQNSVLSETQGLRKNFEGPTGFVRYLQEMNGAMKDIQSPNIIEKGPAALMAMEAFQRFVSPQAIRQFIFNKIGKFQNMQDGLQRLTQQIQFGNAAQSLNTMKQMNSLIQREYRYQVKSYKDQMKPVLGRARAMDHLLGINPNSPDSSTSWVKDKMNEFDLNDLSNKGGTQAGIQSQDIGQGSSNPPPSGFIERGGPGGGYPSQSLPSYTTTPNPIKNNPSVFTDKTGKKWDLSGSIPVEVH